MEMNLIEVKFQVNDRFCDFETLGLLKINPLDKPENGCLQVLNSGFETQIFFRIWTQVSKAQSQGFRSTQQFAIADW